MRCAWIGMVALITATAAYAETPGGCSIDADREDGRLSFHWDRGACASGERCHDSGSDMRWSRWSGIEPKDLGREGATIDARMKAEAGELRCAGTVHGGVLSGTYSFTPDAQFAKRMEAMGFDEQTSDHLQSYALLDVTTAWVKEMKDDGVMGMTPDNLMGLRALKVDAAYVHAMAAAGYPELHADKLTSMKAVGVTPEKVQAVRAMGYKPTQDELIEMSVFKIDAPFVERMRARGFKNPTIAQLVQIKVFKLDE